jgi:phage-related protein
MKRISFIGSSKKDIQAFPDDVKDDVGYALFQVQLGETPTCVKPLKGLGSGVLEIIEDFRTDTYRAVYTVKFDEVIYVLHCFQKKSKQGSKTPPKDLDLIKQRLKAAEEDHRTNYETKKRGE